MHELSIFPLLNLLGFAVGVGLYGLLLFMTWRQNGRKYDFLLSATAICGLLSNSIELFNLIAKDFGIFYANPVLTAISYSALGILPAVTIDSAVRGHSGAQSARFLIWAAYGLSAIAAVSHFHSGIFNGFAPSNPALQVLAFGFLTILFVLFAAFRRSLTRRVILATAVIIFAISAFHLSFPHSASNFWLLEIIGHQASLPLALAILLQDFRFAFADLFLKRALSLVFLTLTAFGLYNFAAAPLLKLHENHHENDPHPTFILLGLWIATALVYPKLHEFAVFLVDKILLRRVNYEKLRGEIADKIVQINAAETVLDEVCAHLAGALTAEKAQWHEALGHEGVKHLPSVEFAADNAEICIPTTETPFYHLTLRQFSGGRRLLSDEREMLEDVALLTARRIDALRVSHERCEQEIREQAVGKLASEAELRALRAQLNPHFLFNALTTIGYLIQTSPEKALATLMSLTGLLRGVLRSTGEFSTLGDELKLIESYLEIEKARFEERLTVEIDIAPHLLKLRVPSLILQPLVENAVKHGISTQKDGGKVTISGFLEKENLILTVADTGNGVNNAKLFERKNNGGVGLNNIEARLKSHYGEDAKFEIESAANFGTIAKISIVNRSVKPQLTINN